MPALCILVYLSPVRLIWRLLLKIFQSNDPIRSSLNPASSSNGEKSCFRVGKVFFWSEIPMFEQRQPLDLPNKQTNKNWKSFCSCCCELSGSTFSWKNVFWVLFGSTLIMGIVKYFITPNDLVDNLSRTPQNDQNWLKVSVQAKSKVKLKYIRFFWLTSWIKMTQIVS